MFLNIKKSTFLGALSYQGVTNYQSFDVPVLAL